MFGPRQASPSVHDRAEPFAAIGSPPAASVAFTRPPSHPSRAAVAAIPRRVAADGRGRWFPRLATTTGLAAAALLLWPEVAPVAAAPALPGDTAVRTEFARQRIMPLARGGDSGRRMEPTAAVVLLASAPERPTVRLTATLGRGDSFGRMLQRAGVGADEAGRIAAMVAAAVPLDELEPGTRFDLTLGRRATPSRPRPVEALVVRARLDLELAVERRGGALALVPRPIAVDATPLRIRGIVGSSLYRSARAAGAPPKAIQQALRALDQNLALGGGEVRPSDAFDIVLGHKRTAMGEAEAGDLLYAGIERGGRPLVQLMRWGGDGQFVAASGVAVRRAAFAAPVAGRITSGFGIRRHPILGFARMHAGLDFRAPWGAPIRATGDGLVQFAGRHGGHGNYVRLAHGGGIGTGYGHMSRIAVAPGTYVRRGDVIGFVGSTGLSTGPHLHYELYRDGRAVDPASVTLVARSPLDDRDLAAFRARLAELRALRPTPPAGLARPAS